MMSIVYDILSSELEKRKALIRNLEQISSEAMCDHQDIPKYKKEVRDITTAILRIEKWNHFSYKLEYTMEDGTHCGEYFENKKDAENRSFELESSNMVMSLQKIKEVNKEVSK